VRQFAACFRDYRNPDLILRARLADTLGGRPFAIIVAAGKTIADRPPVLFRMLRA